MFKKYGMVPTQRSPCSCIVYCCLMHMVNTISPENAVMNLEFPDVPSPNRKAVTNAVHKEVLGNMFLLEWSRSCQRHAELKVVARLDTLPRSLAR